MPSVNMFSLVEQEIRTYNPEINCRSCAHFIRVRGVQDDSRHRLARLVYPQGFCSVMAEGDVRLKTGGGAYCKKHTFSKYNYETFLKERTLGDLWHTYDMKKDDRRTKIHKDMVKSSQELENAFDDLFKIKNMNTEGDGLKDHVKWKNTWGMWRKIDVLTEDYIEFLLEEELKWLERRTHMRADDYWRMCSNLQLFLAMQIEEVLRCDDFIRIENEKGDDTEV